MPTHPWEAFLEVRLAHSTHSPDGPASSASGEHSEVSVVAGLAVLIQPTRPRVKLAASASAVRADLEVATTAVTIGDTSAHTEGASSDAPQPPH